MKHQGLKRLLLIVTIVIAAASFSRGLILTFFYDIFDSCVNSFSTEPSTVCEYGPQVLLNIVAGLVIIGLSYLFLFKATKLTSALAAGLLGVAYTLTATLSWRLLVSLSDNFQIIQGPDSLTEYLFVFYANQEALVIGLVFGLAYNMAEAIGKNSIPEQGRRAPRMKFKKKS